MILSKKILEFVMFSKRRESGLQDIIFLLDVLRVKLPLLSLEEVLISSLKKPKEVLMMLLWL